MAKCIYCGYDTELIENGVPICVGCSMQHDVERKPLTSQEQIRNALLRDALEATARHNAAREEFEAIMGQIPSDLPYADGAQRIKNASRSLSTARSAMMTAHDHFDKFLESGIVPEDLRRSG